MSTPLREFTDPVEIRERLLVLYAKAERIGRYNASCRAGSPDASLLDEKQLVVLAESGRRIGEPMPNRVRRTLKWTIHVLKARLVEVEGRRLT